MTETEFPKTFISVNFCRRYKVAYVPLMTWVRRHAVSLRSTEFLSTVQSGLCSVDDVGA